MQTYALKKTSLIYVLIVVALSLLFSIKATAQDPDTCWHDPYPFDRPSLEVSCDDPSCNVGPCTVQPEQVCWHNPTLENPGSREQNRRVSCDDPACNDGPCTASKDRHGERLEAREERRAVFMEHVQERITALVSHVVRRFEGAILRFEDIIDRLASRIEKLSDRGVETETAEAALQDAKDSLGEAKATLENLGSIQEVVTGDSPREVYMALREELRNIHSLLKETHATLRNVITHLKEALREAEASRGVSSAVTDQAEDTDAEENPDEE